MDDRPLDDVAAVLAGLRAEVEDLKSTNAARIAAATAEARRRPTGSTDLVFRGTPEPGTVFLQGQTLDRADYPALWAWAQASGSVVAGGYGAGNGTTTFTLPDMRDRVLMGAGGAIALGGTGGSATRTLTIANLPAHDHNTSVANHAGHYHAINSSTGSAGDHGGHSSGTATVNNGAGGAYNLPSNYSGGSGGHSHAINTDTGTVGLSAHSVTESPVGSGTAFDNRPPFIGINLAVWT